MAKYKAVAMPFLFLSLVISIAYEVALTLATITLPFLSSISPFLLAM